MKTAKKNISCVLLFATLLSCVSSPVLAADGESSGNYENNSTFWQWAVQSGGFWQQAAGYIPGLGVCPSSTDQKHHADDKEIRLGPDSYICRCKYCGQQFEAYESDIRQAYTDTVNEMPLTGIDSKGGFIWYPTCNDIDYEKQHYIYADGWNFDSLP